MNLKKLAILMVSYLMAFLLGFLAGFIYQKPRVEQLQNEVKDTTTRLEETKNQHSDAQAKAENLEYRLRLATVLDQLTMLHLELLSNNYGNAGPLSSQFFDALRDLEAETQDADLKLRLTEGLGLRDEVTAAIAKADPKVTAKVKWLLLDLHEAAGPMAK